MTNVLFIVCDALRPANLREWGYHRDTAPFITELCEDSTVYRNAYSQYNYTTPSITTMLTGEYYIKTGIWRIFYPPYDESKAEEAKMFGTPYWKWELKCPTLAGKLKDTHRSIIINEVLVDLTDQGGVTWGEFDKAPSNYSGQKGKRIHEKANIPVHPTAEQTTDAALDEMHEAMDDKEDFFMYVHYWDTHWPPSAPEKFIDQFYDGTNPETLHWLFGGKITPDSRRMVREQIAARTESRDMNFLKAWYDAAIYYMDQQIKRLVESVPEDTLIVLTADHGEAMGEHNGIAFGHIECWMYEEVLKVPLIVKYPKWTMTDEGSTDPPYRDSIVKLTGRRTFYNRVENRKIYDIIMNWVNNKSDEQIKSEYIYAVSKASEQFSPHLDILIKNDLKIFVHDFGTEVYGFNLKDDPHERNPLLLQDRPEFDELKELIMPLVEAEIPKPEGAV